MGAFERPQLEDPLALDTAEATEAPVEPAIRVEGVVPATSPSWPGGRDEDHSPAKRSRACCGDGRRVS